jgi:GntR family transcriptional regulator, transcriptional repressor for pyruvate dehydrogenase complex
MLSRFPSTAFDRTSRSNNVLALFKQMIREGQIRPGERLPNERDLARRLGVSRPSLREAVRALAAMKILDVRHGDGTYVTSLDPELLAQPLQLILSIDSSFILDLFELRRIIEPAAAALAAKRATDEELQALRVELERGVASQRHPAALVEYDTTLHRLLHQAAHNPLLVSVSSSLAGLARKSRLRTVRLPENARLTIEEHKAFVEAVCARQPSEAAEAMLRHLERIERQLRGEQGRRTTGLSGGRHRGSGKPALAPSSSRNQQSESGL